MGFEKMVIYPVVPAVGYQHTKMLGLEEYVPKAKERGMRRLFLLVFGWCAPADVVHKVMYLSRFVY